MSDKINPQRLKGSRDYLPADMFARRHVMETLRSIFELHGFAALETPAIEYAATLEGKYERMSGCFTGSRTRASARWGCDTI